MSESTHNELMLVSHSLKFNRVVDIEDDVFKSVAISIIEECNGIDRSFPAPEVIYMIKEILEKELMSVGDVDISKLDKAAADVFSILKEPDAILKGF